jgi:hypothetical protein
VQNKLCRFTLKKTALRLEKSITKGKVEFQTNSKSKKAIAPATRQKENNNYLAGHFRMKQLYKLLFSSVSAARNKQFCTMLAGPRYNEQLIPYLLQSRLCTDSSSVQNI